LNVFWHENALDDLLSNVLTRESITEVSFDDYNHYIPVTESEQKDGLVLYPNSMVSLEIVKRYIAEFLSGESKDSYDLPVRCKLCLTEMSRSSACAVLSHCGWETCCMCGFAAKSIDPGHWKTCPRFFADVQKIIPHFHCHEGLCFNDDGPCQKPEHMLGKIEFQQLQQRIRLERVLASIGAEDRKEIELWVKNQKAK
jgi:hypothetical protein